MVPIREIERSGAPGGAMLGFGLGGFVLAAWLFTESRVAAAPAMAGLGLVVVVAALIAIGGLVMVNPNEAVVLQLFGKYVGTIKVSGLRWVNPIVTKRRVSVRVVSWGSPELKVNDKDGNPIEIGCIVVFKVRDTAQAIFQVDDYAAFVRLQAEASLRNLASRHPYDGDDEGLSLRRNTTEMASELKEEIQSHLGPVGVDVVDAKISHLAYAPEIAHAMLQRQQAQAVIAARTRIVEGAVTMVQLALKHLSDQKIVELDEERKAQMVSNLLVVLCSERSAQPVVNSGTIYQ
ncbi:MAG TPA: SPFH domain-containing protein [Polyangiaceae bacterium]|jgi:regulator of protease activity HflC (stomatin/prohibitin superfamily)